MCKRSRNLDRLHRKSYHRSMTNAAPTPHARDELRATRAAFVRHALEDERWSVRQAAMRTGINHTSLGSRLKGEISFLVEDLEAIAHLLKRDPAEFYAEYLHAADHDGPQKPETAPTPFRGGGRHFLLPELDSNQQPAGIRPAAPARAGILIDLDRMRRLRPRPATTKTKNGTLLKYAARAHAPEHGRVSLPLHG